MKKITTLLFVIISLGAFAQFNVTFQVDMNNYSGSFTTPEVNGDFNAWCGSCAAMTDSDNDGIWDITIAISDSAEFKFSFDNWTGQETLIPGMVCTKTLGNFTNRFMYVTKDTILDPVCWESCVSCGATPVNSNVTFRIDLSDYSGSYNTVNLNGTFNGWCGSCAPMTDSDNDSIYEITVSVPSDTIEYKFTLDGWGTQEQLTPGSSCTQTDGQFTNRYLVPSGDTTLGAVCWESCFDCNTVGIEENNWIESVSLSPNPNNGQFTISSLPLSSSTVISVMDVQGKLIYTQNLEENVQRHEVKLDKFRNGLYIIQIRNDFGLNQMKFLIGS